MKKIKLSKLSIVLVLVVCSVVLTMACSCGQQNNKKELSQQDKDHIAAIVDNFQIFTNVPRPSNHEEKIADTCVKWATDHGFKPERDAANNVVFDVPATSGMENKPLVILQGHIDMVCAFTDNSKDPLTTPIKMNNDGKTLTAEGSSLGADDGIGDAFAMCVAEGKIAHGPVRCLFTTAEETDKTGAFNIDPKYFKDASYCINIDSEEGDAVCVSSASQMEYTFTKNPSTAAPAKDKAFAIKISNVKGGHSGIDINKGRMNAIVELANICKKVKEAGIDLELAEFNAGKVSNAIPPEASVTIVIDSKNVEQFKKLVEEQKSNLNSKYGEADKGFDLSVNDANQPSKVLSAEDTKIVIDFPVNVVNGVYSMSTKMSDLVESSSNLGVAQVNENGIKFVTCVRSSEQDKLNEITNKQKELANSMGMTNTDKVVALPWPVQPNSKLLDLAKKGYKDKTGEDINVTAIHAGLECGNFIKYNPNLDMISIGPTIHDPHTVSESCEIETIPVVWNELESILANIT